MDSLKRFGSFAFMDAWPCGRFNMLIKKSYRMKSWRFVTGMRETVEKMSSALDSEQRPGRMVHGGVFDAYV